METAASRSAGVLACQFNSAASLLGVSRRDLPVGQVWSSGFSRRGVPLTNRDQNAYRLPGWNTPHRLKPGLQTWGSLTDTFNRTPSRHPLGFWSWMFLRSLVLGACRFLAV